MKLKSWVFLLVFPLVGRAECVRFYYVKRPVAPLVVHEYVASETGQRDRQVFGLPKGQADLVLFSRHREGDPESRLSVESLGEACEGRAAVALAAATQVSDEWKARYAAWVPYLARMAASPVLGKPCRRAAENVRQRLLPLLGHFR